MSVRLYQVAVDALAPAALASFWAGVLGYRVLVAGDDEVVIGADEHSYPGMVFLPVPERKARKNRLHLDLVPDGATAADQEAEVERILALGAVRIDVGQPAGAGWTVLADPEGNEFCVLAPKRSLAG